MRRKMVTLHPLRGNWILQQWEGHVSEVNEDTFWVRLYYRKGPVKGEQMCEIKKSFIEPRYRWMIQVGNYLQWTITETDNQFVLLWPRRYHMETYTEAWERKKVEAMRWAENWLKKMEINVNEPLENKTKEETETKVT